MLLSSAFSKHSNRTLFYFLYYTYTIMTISKACLKFQPNAISEAWKYTSITHAISSFIVFSRMPTHTKVKKDHFSVQKYKIDSKMTP